MGFKDTRLWLEYLAGPAEDEARRLLAAAIEDLHRRSSMLAGEINRDLPDFTVHSQDHIDRLWRLADEVRGSDIELNPAEAFVLGAALCVHDLGMALVAYPDGPDELRQGPEWADALRAATAAVLHQPPATVDLTNPLAEAVEQATAELLRRLHAERAGELLDVSWTSGGTDHFLMSSPELRGAYGAVIGQVAASHGRPVHELPRWLPPTVGAAVELPNDWTVAPLKLACILRASDVCHLDASRAPAFLRALRRPQGVAEQHWVAQTKLNQASFTNDRVFFSSGAPFERNEAQAWWQCYAMLSMVDRELRQTDDLLADEGQARLRARGVAGADHPMRLQRYVATRNWVPVDARLHVSDLAGLVRSLGGEALYGSRPIVALRELIQNASDAINARRIQAEDPAHGQVTVSLEQEDDQWVLAVADDGVGMSAATLAGGLVDFGKSFWRTEAARYEHPGLIGAGFAPTGQYGIGFFAAFMLGDHIEVTSRRWDMAQADARTLTFSAGVDGRPVLHDAASPPTNGGTRIRVRLENDPFEEKGLLEGSSFRALISQLSPALSVALEVRTPTEPVFRMGADDWKSIDPLELIKRVGGYEELYPDDHSDEEDAWAPPGYYDLSFEGARRVIQEATRPIRASDGDIVGRGCLLPMMGPLGDFWGVDGAENGAVTVGGLRAEGFYHFAGVMTGNASRASRDQAIPAVAEEDLANWASEQAQLIASIPGTERAHEDIARAVATFGGDTGDLPIARRGSGEELTASEVGEMAAGRTTVLLTSNFDVHPTLADRDDGSVDQGVVEKLDEVLVCSADGSSDLARSTWPPRGYVDGLAEVQEDSLLARCLNEIARAWGCSREALGLVEEEQMFPTPQFEDFEIYLVVVRKPT